MSETSFTLMIVPERSSVVRRITVTKQWLLRSLILLSVLLSAAIFMLVTYVHMLSEYNENPKIKNENRLLKARLQVISDDIQKANASLQRVEQFVVRLRTIAKLNDPARQLALGPLDDVSAKMRPVFYDPDERIESEDEMLDSKLALRLVASEAENLQKDSLKQENTLQHLESFFNTHSGLLAATPLIKPTQSKQLTSSFGVRTDPYTDREVMHKGVDFAAELGAEVKAPADGVVIFAGPAGLNYGNKVVIDHGYGLQTHYAHLSDVLVKLGTRVTREQVIAKVGNTGRTTGAHLHYEVRLYGIPQNPERFMFNE